MAALSPPRRRRAFLLKDKGIGPLPTGFVPDPTLKARPMPRDLDSSVPAAASAVHRDTTALPVERQTIGTRPPRADVLHFAPVALLGIALLAAPLQAARAADGKAAPPEALVELGLDELMRIEVTSVSKRPQRLSDTAAAVSVLTGDDIRRLGVTNIAEALRTIPGVEVARIDGTKWAVSVRGFNGGYSTKLLVLVDGRSVYSPLFSGVFWDHVDTMLEDIDRIEVIRGPGAAIWGSNAVNGVINIITKRAADTQGTLVSFAAGPDERRTGARFGTTTGDGTQLRLYALNVDRDDTSRIGTSVNGGVLRQTRVGMRAEKAVTERDHLTLQGEAFAGNSGGVPSSLPVDSPIRAQAIAMDSYTAGGHVKARWTHELASGGSLAGDFYFDHNVRRRLVGQEDTSDTWDLALQHTFTAGERHKIVWGGGGRSIRYAVTNSFQINLPQPWGREELLNLFAQDEIALLPDRLRLTLGAKVERSSLVNGPNLQPDARLLWNVDAEQVLWAAVSRANRLPSLVEKTATVRATFVPPVSPSPFPIVGVIDGNEGLRPERLTSYQVGYRNAVNANLTLDVTAFVHRYRDLILATGGPTCGLAGSPPSYLECAMQFRNAGIGKAHGAEAVVDWRPFESLRVQTAWSVIDLDVPADTNGIAARTPNQQMSLRLSHDVSDKVQTDLIMRRVSGLGGRVDVPAYNTADARLAWRPERNLELSLTGRNLFDPRRVEFSDDPFFTVGEVRRSFIVAARWSF